MDAKLAKYMKYVPITVATTPKTGEWRLRVNAWWSVIEHKGQECIMFYNGYAPQCNENKSIVDDISRRLYPEAKVMQIPVVYIPLESDYGRE